MFFGALRIVLVLLSAFLFSQASFSQPAPIELVTIKTAQGEFKYSTEIAKTSYKFATRLDVPPSPTTRTRHDV